MRRITIAGVWVGLFIALTPVPAQEPPEKPAPRLADILDGVKQRGEAQRREDQRRALLLLQQAQAAEQAGRLAEAVELADQAQQLFPESPDIRRVYASLIAQQREREERSANLAVARQRIEDALEHARVLLREGRLAEARDLAEAVREASTRMPPDSDARQAQRDAADLLRQASEGAPSRPNPPPREVLIARFSLEALHLALTRRIAANWQNETLETALEDIAQATGVPISVDRTLEDTGRVAPRPLNLLVYNASGEHALRLVCDRASVGFVFFDGQVVITTKARAHEYNLRRAPDRGRPVFVALRQIAPVAVEAPPPVPEEARPEARQVPEYLRSGRAFRERIDELLGPANRPLLPP